MTCGAHTKGHKFVQSHLYQVVAKGSVALSLVHERLMQPLRHMKLLSNTLAIKCFPLCAMHARQTAIWPYLACTVMVTPSLLCSNKGTPANMDKRPSLEFITMESQCKASN